MVVLVSVVFKKPVYNHCIAKYRLVAVFCEIGPSIYIVAPMPMEDGAALLPILSS